jgi:hypothetical protein
MSDAPAQITAFRSVVTLAAASLGHLVTATDVSPAMQEELRTRGGARLTARPLRRVDEPPLARDPPRTHKRGSELADAAVPGVCHFVTSA